MTVPSVSGKSRNVKNRSSTAPISAAGRSGRSFIVFLRKDAVVHCAMPGIGRSRVGGGPNRKWEPGGANLTVIAGVHWPEGFAGAPMHSVSFLFELSFTVIEVFFSFGPHRP